MGRCRYFLLGAVSHFFSRARQARHAVVRRVEKISIDAAAAKAAVATAPRQRCRRAFDRAGATACRHSFGDAKPTAAAERAGVHRLKIFLRERNPVLRRRRLQLA